MSYIEFTKKAGKTTAEIDPVGLDQKLEEVKAAINQNTIDTTALVQEGIELQKELNKLLAIKDELK